MKTHRLFSLNARSTLSLFLGVGICLFNTGCERAAEDDATGQSESKRKIVIGFIGKSLTNDVFQAAQAGAEDAAKVLGERYKVDVEIEVRTPNDEDAIKQAEAIDAFIRRRVDGITISCTEANTVTPFIDKAVSRGIPLVCFDSDAPESKRMAYYGADDRACGEAIMGGLIKAMGGKGVIAILGGNQSAPNLQRRIHWAKEEAAKYPAITLNNPSVFYHTETPEKSAEAVRSAQNVNAGIEGWCFIGGWPLFTADALKWPAGSVKVSSCDALPAQLNYVREGQVDVLFAQDCYGWGYKTVEILLKKVLLGEGPSSEIITDPLVRVTKENVDEMAQNWERWLNKKKD